MNNPEFYREIIKSKLDLIEHNGGWEGIDQDLKFKLKNDGDDNKSIWKIIKHTLSFANTPRVNDAFIIFGILEDKQNKKFELKGFSSFPDADKIHNLINSHTNLDSNSIFIDSFFKYNNLKFPFIVINKICYNGPYYLLHKIDSCYSFLKPETLYIRENKSSVIATTRDQNKMKEHWDSWIINENYTSNKDDLFRLIQNRFPSSQIYRLDDYIKFIFEQQVTDYFGTRLQKTLVHAYHKITDPEKTIKRLVADDTVSTNRIIVSTLLTKELFTLADKNNIQCIEINNLFKADAYSKYCEAYLKVWATDCDNLSINSVVDLDYKYNKERHKSILSFLEKLLSEKKCYRIIVSGDLGTGKTITAKYLTKIFTQEYLSKSQSMKVIYINLNNYDIRTKISDIVTHLLQVDLSLPQDEVFELLRLVERNEIHFIFDSVDEMGRPYTQQGRQEVMEILRTIGNNSSSVYFFRAPYFKSKKELIKLTTELSSYDHNLHFLEICELTDDQYQTLIYNNLNTMESQELILRLLKTEFKDTLRDPLILWLIIEYLKKIKNGNIDFLLKNILNNRIAILDSILNGLLKREQEKRNRHSVMSGRFFQQFVYFLYRSAFFMVNKKISSLPLDNWDNFVESHFKDSEITSFNEEAIDAFRTMAWVHRDDEENTIKFRNDLLTLICAAKYIKSVLSSPEKNYDLLGELDETSINENNLLDYVATLTTSEEFIKMLFFLMDSTLASANRLILQVILKIDSEVIYKGKYDNITFDSSNLARLGLCMLNYPITHKYILHILSKKINNHRFAQLLFPVITSFSLSLVDKENINKEFAILLLKNLVNITSKWSPVGKHINLNEQIKYIKHEKSEFYDRTILSILKVSQKSIVACESYFPIINLLSKEKNLEIGVQAYINKSMKGKGY